MTYARRDMRSNHGIIWCHKPYSKPYPKFIINDTHFQLLDSKEQRKWIDINDMMNKEMFQLLDLKEQQKLSNMEGDKMNMKQEKTHKEWVSYHQVETNRLKKIHDLVRNELFICREERDRLKEELIVLKDVLRSTSELLKIKVDKLKKVDCND